MSFYRKSNECTFEGYIHTKPQLKNDVLFFMLSVPKNDNKKIKIQVPIYAYKTTAAILFSKLSLGDLVYVETIYQPFREGNKVTVKFDLTRLFQITQGNYNLRYSQD